AMATAHVTGAWAVLKQAAPRASVDRVLSALRDTGTPISDTRTGGTVTKGRIDVAAALTALTGTATLTASPTTVAPSGVVTAAWSGIVAPTPTDWMGLFVPGAPDGAYRAWLYVSCSQSPGAARAAGACAIPLPSGVGPGTYELRLFAGNGFARLATSPPFTVTAVAGGVVLTESPTTVSAGGSVTAAWSGIASPTSTDWIGLFMPGAPDTSLLAWN